MKNNVLFNSANVCNSEKYVKKYNISLHEAIANFNVNNKGIRWAGMVYNYINNISEIPKCLCGNNLGFINYNIGYRRYCSTKCSANSSETNNKKINTSIMHYGCEHPTQDSKIKKKREETNFIKYGVINPSQSQIVKDKKKETLYINYGVTYPSQSQIIKDKVINTNIERHGVKNVSQLQSVKEKKIITVQKNYGVDHTFQSIDIKNISLG